MVPPPKSSGWCRQAPLGPSVHSESSLQDIQSSLPPQRSAVIAVGALYLLSAERHRQDAQSDVAQAQHTAADSGAAATTAEASVVDVPVVDAVAVAIVEVVEVELIPVTALLKSAPAGADPGDFRAGFTRSREVDLEVFAFGVIVRDVFPGFGFQAALKRHLALPCFTGGLITASLFRQSRLPFGFGSLFRSGRSFSLDALFFCSGGQSTGA